MRVEAFGLTLPRYQVTVRLSILWNTRPNSPSTNAGKLVVFTVQKPTFSHSILTLPFKTRRLQQTMFIHRSTRFPLFLFCFGLMVIVASAKDASKNEDRRLGSLRATRRLRKKTSSCEEPWAPINTVDCSGSDVFTQTKSYDQELCARCKPCSEVQSGDQCVNGETCVKSTYTCCDGTTVDMEGFHCSDGTFKQSLVDLSPDCTVCKQSSPSNQ